MRAVAVLGVFVLLLASAHALGTTEINITAPANGSTVGDFNVVWEVNTTGDWNYFVVSFKFGKVYGESRYSSTSFTPWSAPVGSDYNETVPLTACDTNTNPAICSLDFNQAHVLRDGSLTVIVYGYDANGNLISDSNVSVTLSLYTDVLSASKSAFSPTGEINITVSTECNGIVGSISDKAFVLHTPSGVVYAQGKVSGTNIILSVSGADVNKIVFGAVFELNVADLNYDANLCSFPPDTNVFVSGLPDLYVFIREGTWTPISIPFIMDKSFSDTNSGFNELNALLKYSGGWSNANVFSEANDSYVFYGYYAYADKNVWIPFRYYDIGARSSCPSSNYYVSLGAGWHLITVYCLNGASSCSDTNSSLYTMSFLDVNASQVRPFFQYFAAPGGTASYITGFGDPDITTLVSGKPYWIWINPNWLLSSLSVRDYGTCVALPTP